MCEYCLQHGEGLKWYLQAKNYSDDLLSDLRRRKFIEDFFLHPETIGRDRKRLKLYDRAPAAVQAMVRLPVVRHMKKTHYGQVLPIEDVARIFEFVSTVIRLPCICRHVSLGREVRACYGLGLKPDSKLYELIAGLHQSFLFGPGSAGLELVTKEEALTAMREHEREGMCHTVWTFQTPFIGGICNCDRLDCIAMQVSVTHGIPIFFRAEYVAATQVDLCKGCRNCIKVCPFGAIGYSPTTKKTRIDPRRCYGCGICRAVCQKDAIVLQDRRSEPLAASVW